MIAHQFISEGTPVRKALSILKLSPSSLYYKKSKKALIKNGAAPSTTTLNYYGEKITNDIVVTMIEKLLAKEFVDYGYLKTTYHLQDEQKLIINKKKVYRLMQENKLLLPKTALPSKGKKWVKNLLPEANTPFSYWEFDIKFMYVTGEGCYWPLLSVIDVKSRWLLGHMCKKSIKKEDVKMLMEEIIATYSIPEKITVRNDNGSQFESNLIREYFAKKGIIQEFTKPATPEQNAHIESYHSILEKVICKRYEFEKGIDLIQKLQQWTLFYNYERIHSGTNYISPYKNLVEQDFDTDEKFFKPKQINKYIFIALNEKETSSAEEQLDRDNLTDRNEHPPKINE
jgi:putative transposase